ncbi:putative 3-oxo-5-alpha-steroid 4-dehydrogenase [Aspergillus clavatus NRRL 1]|uniref:Polyprenal reductase n=1 Tax=Aspergillus clavatus (strain ATCC 1007 / CBS 513.65 / DSM 816 / NCTC 3887 / NRRL 1 / QM 1276 / 107) TaxID=344612 RepID=A1CRC0_ASPCL|nr:3-oxo-5-alpha-steroid 4-dehydrogenase, putative [Aspergillus clavatus NRRL 1]EAW08191.1 3-oxo-5-alpha-steroid 4-dehydrogenase, putative [Aspergillus clavatus NRRL 1]
MDLITKLVDTTLSITHMDAVDALRAFFIFATCLILSVSLPDTLRSRFVTYGARATSPPIKSESLARKASDTSLVTLALDYLASLRVPHSYFLHFYVAAVLSSLFWAAQLVSRGAVFQAIAARVGPEHLEKSMNINQLFLCWVLMFVQGVRRLHESRIFAKPSSSRMWFVHWLLGLAFYLMATTAIWIEGTGTLMIHKLSLDDVQIATIPTLRTFLCLPIFLFASGIQHDCHHYLFSLKKYTLPTHPMFRAIVCPHYTAECAIYLSLALLAAPQGEWVNKTLLSCFAFVIVNLGVTAAISKQWYKQKFGPEAVKGKWNMVPGVF